MTALTFCGSTFGVLTWGAWMGYLVNEYTGLHLLAVDPGADRFRYFAQAEQWVAVYANNRNHSSVILTRGKHMTLSAGTG